MKLNHLTSFANVAPGATATVLVPLGPTYERFVFNLGGTTFTTANITQIRCRINGKLCYIINGSDLLKVNAYYGLYTSGTNQLTLDFSEIFARDQVGQSIGAIATSYGIQTFQMEVDINAAAVAPTLDCYAVTSPPRAAQYDAQGRPILVIEKLLQYQASFAAAGKFTLPVPFGANGSVIKRVYFFHNNIGALEIKKNGLIVHEGPLAVLQQIQLENRKVPQAGLLVYDAVVDNNMNQMLPTTDASAFEINVTLTAGDTIRYLVEYIDPLGNL